LLVLDTASAQGAPRISWGYSDSGFRGEVAGSRTIEETLGPGLWEFQPGPRFVGGRVLVQARQWEADESSSSGRGGPIASIDESTVRAWCLAFDADSGLPSWKTLLAVGPSAEVRLWGARGIARPADPIVQVAGRVFASTGIGAGVWLDAGTGRAIRSIRNRRAPQGSPRWRRGAAAPNLPGDAEAPVAMLWAPSDSDRLYSLDAATASGSFHRAPVEIGNAREIVGLTGETALVIEDGGGRANLLLVDLVTGARTRSVPYPRGERLAGGSLASARRAIVASERGVRLFDLERDLELLDAIVLDGSDVDPVSGIAARGDRVFVASERALWILRAR
jgi:hypothetical protein